MLSAVIQFKRKTVGCSIHVGWIYLHVVHFCWLTRFFSWKSHMFCTFHLICPWKIICFLCVQVMEGGRCPCQSLKTVKLVWPKLEVLGHSCYSCMGWQKAILHPEDGHEVWRSSELQKKTYMNGSCLYMGQYYPLIKKLFHSGNALTVESWAEPCIWYIGRSPRGFPKDSEPDFEASLEGTNDASSDSSVHVKLPRQRSATETHADLWETFVDDADSPIQRKSFTRTVGNVFFRQT